MLPKPIINIVLMILVWPKEEEEQLLGIYCGHGPPDHGVNLCKESLLDEWM